MHELGGWLDALVLQLGQLGMAGDGHARGAEAALGGVEGRQAVCMRMGGGKASEEGEACMWKGWGVLGEGEREDQGWGAEAALGGGEGSPGGLHGSSMHVGSVGSVEGRRGRKALGWMWRLTWLMCIL